MSALKARDHALKRVPLFGFLSRRIHRPCSTAGHSASRRTTRKQKTKQGCALRHKALKALEKITVDALSSTLESTSSPSALALHGFLSCRSGCTS